MVIESWRFARHNFPSLDERRFRLNDRRSLYRSQCDRCVIIDVKNAWNRDCLLPFFNMTMSVIPYRTCGMPESPPTPMRTSFKITETATLPLP